MRPIQVFLIPILVILAGHFYQRLRHRPWLRLLVTAIFLTAIGFTFFPDASTIVANYLGIGRGVDLLIYLALLGLTVSCVLLYLRILRLEERLANLTRAMALGGAEAPPPPDLGQQGND